MKKRILLFILISACAYVDAQTGIKILFDARKAQMAANADWIVDADLYNIGTGTGGIMQTGKGSEANPQRYPTPAQSGITSSTSETYWKGALSAWGVSLAKLGYTVETLPYNGAITYGVSSNSQDLSNYKVFICDEPNIRFTSAEKTALLQFVQNGGGLFMIADHDVSDRNNDSWDSPHIWNDLMNSNGSVTNPFGITFDYANFSQTTTNFAVLSSNAILHGSAGNPVSMKFSNGTSMTLNKTKNANATGLVYKTGSSKTGTTGVMMAQSKYGTGKIAALGDSSPPDDGTGDNNDNLYNGWSAEVNGDHSRIILNATIWLSNSSPRMTDDQDITVVNIWPNPFNDLFNISYLSEKEQEISITAVDISGRIIFQRQQQCVEGVNLFAFDKTNFPAGAYIISVSDGNNRITKKLIAQ